MLRNKKTILIEQYEAKVVIVNATDTDKIKKVYGIEFVNSDKATDEAISVELDNGFYIFFKGVTPEIIAHESFHIVNMIHRRYGVQHTHVNDEVFAYLLGFIVKRITKEIYGSKAIKYKSLKIKKKIKTKE